MEYKAEHYVAAIYKRHLPLDFTHSVNDLTIEYVNHLLSYKELSK